MFFQFKTTNTANKIRLVRPGPVTKLVISVLQSMCATDSPATAAPPIPRGNKTPSAFADAIVFLCLSCPPSSKRDPAKALERLSKWNLDHRVLRAVFEDEPDAPVASEKKKRLLIRRRAKPNSSTMITTIHNGTERKTQVIVVPHFARMEEEEAEAEEG